MWDNSYKSKTELMVVVSYTVTCFKMRGLACSASLDVVLSTQSAQGVSLVVWHLKIVYEVENTIDRILD